ncbi:MAG: Uma2 family endonuclease [Betaproteobacteria bacterium]|nr:Uma2 family endonuclease [Betaproteobacteria bacterium]
MGAEIPLPRRTLSVEDYHRMGEVGLFAPEERLELIHGDLVTMAPIGGPHLRLVNVLAQLFSMRLGRSAVVSVQNPICIPPDSEPQPDIVLLRSECWGRAAVPTANDILLVIEVADTTLARDRDIKIPLYARHDIPEAWLFDAASGATTIYRGPRPEGYRTELSPARDAIISPQLRPDVAISLAEVWLATAG